MFKFILTNIAMNLGTDHFPALFDVTLMSLLHKSNWKKFTSQ